MTERKEIAPYVDEKKKRDFELARKAGQVCGLILLTCTSSVVIALTFKLVMWILGL